MNLEIVAADSIKDKVYTIRGVQVMLDSDLAEIYGYSTKAFNQQVRNNSDKFPEDMMFQLTQNDCDSLSRSIFLTSIMQTKGMKGGRTSLPYAFTEQGIYMLMTVLKGELATQQSLALVRMFKRMRQYYVDNSLLFQRLDKVELWQIEADVKFKRIFEKLEEPREKKAVLFFKGQLYDAFSCIAEIIGKSESSIILVDGYVDTATLDLLSKKRRGVAVEVFTNQSTCRLTSTEVQDFNGQYGGLQVRYTTDFHDRFLILDGKELYHIGASLKDAGKKAFEISHIDDDRQVVEILKRLGL